MRYVATVLLEQLVRAGAEVDCFVAARREDLPPRLLDQDGLRVFATSYGERLDRWYERVPLATLLAVQTARAAAQAALARDVARRHRERPYDVLYQFSQLELLGLRPLRHRLPPIVLHPEVHAAGELRWHRAERSLARYAEGRARPPAARAMLAARAWTQRRDAALAAAIVAPSGSFAALLARDLDVDADRVKVVPNPVDLARFSPGAIADAAERPLRVLVVSRLSVRKGIEMVVALSRRLADLAGRLTIRVIGAGALWSDYTRLLEDMHPAIADVGKHIHDPATLTSEYRSSDLLLAPSWYEPFGLTAAEALACGRPVLATDAVGAVEEVRGRCVERVAIGDVDAMEAAIRRHVADPSRVRDAAVRAQARAEAERLFAPADAADRLEEIFTAVSATPAVA